ncbi:hypothetical protein BH10ACT9_BH10ACT9_60750 [soil metagenome]
MTTTHTPRHAAAVLPDGAGESVAGFGIMGLPLANGKYLAFRDFPAASFLPASAPGYRTVWHRDPDGVWTFYATTAAQVSCARYFSSAMHTTHQCAVDTEWTDDYTLVIDIPDVLHWTVRLERTPASTALSWVGERLPNRVWTSRRALGVLGRVAGPLLRTGDLRLAGTLPNGQDYRIAPKLIWTVAESRAELFGVDLGPAAALAVQARLGAFLLPQRGVAVVGQGRFEAFDPRRHVSADDKTPGFAEKPGALT